jgi:hypothetical protein
MHFVCVIRIVRTNSGILEMLNGVSPPISQEELTRAFSSKGAGAPVVAATVASASASGGSGSVNSLGGVHANSPRVSGSLLLSVREGSPQVVLICPKCNQPHYGLAMAAPPSTEAAAATVAPVAASAALSGLQGQRVGGVGGNGGVIGSLLVDIPEDMTSVYDSVVREDCPDCR